MIEKLNIDNCNLFEENKLLKESKNCLYKLCKELLNKPFGKINKLDIKK